MCVETGEQVTGEQMSPLSAKSFSSSTHIPTFVYVCVCVYEICLSWDVRYR